MSSSNIEKITVGKGAPFLSSAVKIPGLIFISGQVPVKDGKVVEGGIAEHTAQVVENITKVLEASGSSWEKVVKCNIYLKDMTNFAAMNEVYTKLLPDPKPARTCIQVVLPGPFEIEIECIAAY